MESHSRHQCMLYEGAPSRHLKEIASVARDMLSRNYRCLYLNSPPMVAGMRSYLAAAGVDVDKVQSNGSLELSSDQSHLVEEAFDPDRMIHHLEHALEKAIEDGFAGLWATGDMTWEMGPHRDFSKLLDYEWKLEKFIRDNPKLCGICQYHADTLPRDVLRVGLISHPAIFVNSTLSRINRHFLLPESAHSNPDWDQWLKESMA